jgi:transcriptional regulator with XRE-family HTH domain
MAQQLGNAIRMARENGGLTQTQLAKAVGITQPRISSMERGDSVPTLTQIASIEKALKLERGFILRAAGRVALPAGSEVDPAELTVRLQRAVNELGAIAQALGYKLVPKDPDEDQA